MSVTFQKATKQQAKARVAITGPAGSGKTYTALRLAKGMGGKAALIDTEHGSASKYADEFGFDVLQLTNFHPDRYVEAIKAAEAAGYDVLVIDSASHEWNGIGGCLELVDDAARRNSGGNSYVAWKDVTPLHNKFIESIHQSKLHVFATFRSKMDYVQGEKNGRKTVEKVGMAPITRDGAEYEFDIVLDIDHEHVAVVSKSRAKALADTVHKKPGEELAHVILAWLTDGASPVKNAPSREANSGTGAEPPSDTSRASSSAPPPPQQARTAEQILEDTRLRLANAPKPTDYADEDAVCPRCGTKEGLRPLNNPRFCAKANGGCGAPARGDAWELISYGQWRQGHP